MSCIRIVLLGSFCLLLSGCGHFFSDFVNFGFSREGLGAVFAFFGGSGVESEIEPLTLQPAIVLGNGLPESASVAIPDGPFILPVGNPFGIGDMPGQSPFSLCLGMEISELSGIIRYDIDADENDNDAEQLLVEIVTGRSGAFFDYETTPVISGVELTGIGPFSYTLAFSDGPATDSLTLSGEGVRAILRNLDSPADATDAVNALSLIDVAADSVLLGNGKAINPIHATAGNRLEGAGEIHAFLDAVLSETPSGIRLLGGQAGSVAMFVSNPATGTRDLFIFLTLREDGAGEPW